MQCGLRNRQCQCRCEASPEGATRKCRHKPRNQHDCMKCHTLLGTGCCWIEHRQLCRLFREEQLFSPLLYLCHCKPRFGCRGLCAKCRGIPRRKTARFPDEINATWSSDGRWRWNLAPRSQRPWTYSVSWMRGAEGSDASPEEFLAERRQASSRDKCAMKQ